MSFRWTCRPIEIPNEGVFMRRRGVASRGVVGSWMFILAALLLASSAYAAEVTASLLGTVRDASGAVVTGANISLTNKIGRAHV